MKKYQLGAVVMGVMLSLAACGANNQGENMSKIPEKSEASSSMKSEQPMNDQMAADKMEHSKTGDMKMDSNDKAMKDGQAAEQKMNSEMMDHAEMAADKMEHSKMDEMKMDSNDKAMKDGQAAEQKMNSEMMDHEKMADKMEHSKMDEMKMDKKMGEGAMEETKMADKEMDSQKMNDGEMAADFTLKDKDDNEFSLASVKGKKAYVKFWASWCSICLVGLEELNTLAGKDNDFEIVTVVSPGVRGEKSKEEFIKWFDTLGYSNIRVLFDEGAQVGDAYGVRAYPTSAFIGSDGVLTKLLPGHVGSEEIEKILAEIK